MGGRQCPRCGAEYTAEEVASDGLAYRVVTTVQDTLAAQRLWDAWSALSGPDGA